VYQNKYVALPVGLVTAAGMPDIPAVLNQDQEDMYVIQLQAALKQDICKLDSIYSLQPSLAVIQVRCPKPTK
jgi:hypothetical protein